MGDRDLLEGVDWKLMPGHRVGLVGANGAGKSTLLRCLTGQRVVSSGRATPFPCLVSPCPLGPSHHHRSHAHVLLGPFTPPPPHHHPCPMHPLAPSQVDAGKMTVAHKIELGYLEQTAVSGSDRSVWDEARSRMTDLLEAEALLEEAGRAMERGEWAESPSRDETRGL